MQTVGQVSITGFELPSSLIEDFLLDKELSFILTDMNVSELTKRCRTGTYLSMSTTDFGDTRSCVPERQYIGSHRGQTSRRLSMTITEELAKPSRVLNMQDARVIVAVKVWRHRVFSCSRQLAMKEGMNHALGRVWWEK